MRPVTVWFSLLLGAEELDLLSRLPALTELPSAHFYPAGLQRLHELRLHLRQFSLLSPDKRYNAQGLVDRGHIAMLAGCSFLPTLTRLHVESGYSIIDCAMDRVGPQLQQLRILCLDECHPDSLAFRRPLQLLEQLRLRRCFRRCNFKAELQHVHALPRLRRLHVEDQATMDADAAAAFESAIADPESAFARLACFRYFYPRPSVGRLISAPWSNCPCRTEFPLDDADELNSCELDFLDCCTGIAGVE